MKRKIFCLAITLLLGSVMFIGCASDKGPAEQAVKAAEEAINSTKAEAAKYVPDQVKSLESALAAVKDKFAKGEYKAAISEAQALAGKAKGVVDAAKAKKEELTKTWTNLNEGLPKMVEAIQSRVDILSQSKKLPANLTAEKFAEAKTGLAAAKEEWAKALENFKAGNYADAVSVANSVKEKAVKAMETLGLPVPAGAKS
jgi:DNA repair exonuclease SbcCD ATPase subunit